MILQPTVTRCGARPIAGDTRESSWPMVSQPSKTRRSRHTGLIIFYGKASEINAFPCAWHGEVVAASSLLLALGRTLCRSLFPGLGVGFIFDSKFTSVTVGIYVHDSVTSQWYSCSLVEILKAIYTGEDFRPLLYKRG